ncbi:unnamed protein product, partial [Vitis vinifera]|uniref:Uncharacterized protein n=1 Tax=Vitis vinifera TaxID=29760 RepID=D7T549_VITVI
MEFIESLFSSTSLVRNTRYDATAAAGDGVGNLHIALNGLNVLLFIWQIPTGIKIVFKVFEFANWH